jgi:cell division protein FtsQ
VVFEKMIRRILKILTWIGIAAWFVVILGFVSDEADQVLCNRIDVVISDTARTGFVTASDIRTSLRSADIELQGYPVHEINTRKLEGILEENPYIRDAEISTDITGRMEVRVEQRVPLVRVMPLGRRGFYLDTEGRVLPLSEQFTPHILLVSGHIITPQGSSPGEELQEIYDFCSFVEGHPFWREQIVQVYVDRRGEVELIPRVGAHQILLGSLEEWKTKLNNLVLLYEQGLPAYGWNSYRTINLKYTNQVICTKR